MKCKVKGLVFVGFAAAILAGAAHAGDENIVTSKAYTDATYQAKSTALSVGNTGGAWLPADQTVSDGATSIPTTAAVKTYVDTALTNNGGTVNNVDLTINQNGVEAGSFSTNQSTASSVNILAPDWDQASGQQAILNKPTITNNNSDITGATSSDTKELPTTYAVQQYVTDAISTNNTNNVGNGALTVTINGTSATGTYTANQASGSTLAFTGIEETAHKANTITTGDGGNVDSTNYPTTNAVVNYVDSAIAQNNTDTAYSSDTTNMITVDATNHKINAVTGTVATGQTGLVNGGQVADAIATAQQTNANTYQEKSTGSYKVGGTGGTWETMTSGTYTTLSRDATTDPNNPTVKYDINAATTAAGVTTGATTIPTSGAVADAIAAATGNQTIPQKDTTTCTAEYPCALVAEGNRLNWRVMAVSAGQTTAAGTCGNANDNCGDA